MPKDKGKTGDFSKLMVITVVALNILFTAAVLYVFLKTSNEPSTLIASWFAFTVGELWLLAGIKRAKVSKIKDRDDPL